MNAPERPARRPDLRRYPLRPWQQEHLAGWGDLSRRPLRELLEAAANTGWAGQSADDLAAAIEDRIVLVLPERLRRVLGSDEACQRARVLAWEQCRALAADPPSNGAGWGYLANLVRWRLSDAVRAEVLRNQRHPVFGAPPDRVAQSPTVDLGPRLERLADELTAAGLETVTAYRLLRAAAEGPRFERAYIAARVVQAGANERQAEALAWLLRGGPGFESVLSRLARGESPQLVFGEPPVRRRITRAATASRPTPTTRPTPAASATQTAALSAARDSDWSEFGTQLDGPAHRRGLKRPGPGCGPGLNAAYHPAPDTAANTTSNTTSSTTSSTASGAASNAA